VDPATPFRELNAVLEELVAHARAVFDQDLVGAYLVGSFALGDADVHSDCDFLVVVHRPITPDQETALRAFHRQLPCRAGHWNRHMEGSYAVVGDLRTLDRLGEDWLYVDHGKDTMEWSTHCNSEVHRWTLRQRGVTLFGPAPRSFACEVPPEVLRARMRAGVQTFLPDLFSWIDFGSAWAQRYGVTTLCRMLYTIETGTLCSKRAALVWGTERLDPRWRDLVQHALDERGRGLDFGDPPRPGSVELTLAFADYAQQVAWCDE
jgi:hypothetical protein